MSNILATLTETVITATVTNPADIAASLGVMEISATVSSTNINATVASAPVTATLVNGGTVTATVTEAPITAVIYMGVKFGQVCPYVAKTADYTIDTDDYAVDVTANNVNITLPTAVGFTGQIFQINNSGTGTVTVLAAQTINGDASVQLSQWEQITVMSDGANWKLIY